MRSFNFFPILLLAFFGLSFWHLDQFPEIHNDETGIAEPGYQLFCRGVYGSRMYFGLYGREALYLETMPLMPLLEGASTCLLGAGIFQMRVIPVLAGGAVLGLTYLLALELTSQRVTALLAVLLLLTWQLHENQNNPFLGSGVTLIDVSRLARYDILAAAFGLGAFWVWRQAQKSRNPIVYFLSGILISLAGLAHVYGFFWLVVLGILTWLETPAETKRSKIFTLLAGTFTPLFPWLMVIWKNWPLFTAQFLIRHQHRLSMMSPAFYWENLTSEMERYHLGLQSPETYGRVGFWLFALGLPISLVLLGHVTRGRGKLGGLWLASLVFPLLFALFLHEKRVYYLITIIPLFAMVLAWAMVQTWNSGQRSLQLIIGGALLLTVLQGVKGIVALHAQAADRVSPVQFFATLREAAPPDGIILGPQTFWPAFADRDYRSVVYLAQLTLPGRPEYKPFPQALEILAPEVVVVHPLWFAWFKEEDQTAFWAYLETRRAHLVGEWVDHEGYAVQMYQLNP